MSSQSPEIHKPGHDIHCHCSACFPGDGIRRQPLLSLCGVTFCREERKVLSDVNFTADRGDFIAITGPNGGGKTTLLRLILGLLKPTEGRIVYYNEAGHASAVTPKFGYLPQKNSVDSHFPITVGEVVASGLLGSKGMSDTARKARVAEVLRLIEMSDLAGRPLSYIDKHFEEHLYSIISEMAPYTTILLVSHEMSQISAMANRHIIVDHSLHECTATHHYLKPECE